jgi:hypothetical protein
MHKNVRTNIATLANLLGKFFPWWQETSCWHTPLTSERFVILDLLDAEKKMNSRGRALYLLVCIVSALASFTPGFSFSAHSALRGAKKLLCNYNGLEPRTLILGTWWIRWPLASNLTMQRLYFTVVQFSNRL